MCSLRDSRLARSCSLSVGGAAPRAAGFLFGICHGRRATGSTSPPAACTGKVMGLGRVLAPRFQAGTIVLFIRWRGGAARRRISFWHLPWPPSYGVDVTAGRSHRQGDGSRTCARSEIPGWHDRALYPLAGRRARRRISFWHLPWPPSYGVDVTAGGLHRQGDGSRTCARSEIPGWHDRALYPLAGRRRAPPDL